MPRTNTANTSRRVLFTVIEKDFEYNDETYQPQEGGRPRKIFASKEKAEAFALEKTLEDFRSQANQRYGSFVPFEASYEGEIFNVSPRLTEVLAKYELTLPEEWDEASQLMQKINQKLPTMCVKDSATIFTSLLYPLFEVYEVEVDADLTA